MMLRLLISLASLMPSTRSQITRFVAMRWEPFRPTLDCGKSWPVKGKSPVQSSTNRGRQLSHPSANSPHPLSFSKPTATHDELIELLAGPHEAGREGQRVHEEIAKGIRPVMDGQRLVSLDTLLALDQGLADMARGEQV